MNYLYKIISPIIIILYLILLIITFNPSYRYYTSSDITHRDFKQHVRYISDDSLMGRYPDSQGSFKAREWIINHYKKWKLYPLFDGEYLQSFSFSGLNKKVGENIIKLMDCKEHCSLPVEPLTIGNKGTFKAKVLYGGYCINEYNEIEQLIKTNNIKNTNEYVLICKRFGPSGQNSDQKDYNKIISFENKYKNIEKLGFQGVIFLRDNGNIIKTDQVSFTYKGKPFAVFLDNQSYSIENIKNNDNVEFIINYEQEQLKGYNIGSSLKPWSPDQYTIYIGAHYDHLGLGIPYFSLGPMGEVYNGADDNASGTSGVLELAEYFKTMIQKNPTFLPDNWNIVFLHFDGEEWGLLGSEEFVKSKYYSLNPIIMLNFDMIGRYSNALYLQGKDTGDENWQKLIESVVSDYQKNKFIKIEYMKGGSGPSDHATFYKKNIPVLFFFTGSHEDYHKPSDDYEKLNYKDTVMILNVAKDILLKLIQERMIPAYRKADEEQRSYQYKVRLGIVPKNYFSGEGLEVGGFVEGAPIQKSGIREGDIIIQIDTVKIQTIHDLMDFLSRATLNKKYKLIYKRSNQKYETEIELMGNP